MNRGAGACASCGHANRHIPRGRAAVQPRSVMSCTACPGGTCSARVITAGDAPLASRRPAVLPRLGLRLHGPVPPGSPDAA